MARPPGHARCFSGWSFDCWTAALLSSLTLPRLMSADGLFAFTSITLSPKKELVTQCSVKCYQVICTTDSSTFNECKHMDIHIILCTHQHRKFGWTVYYQYGAYKYNFMTFFSLYSLCFSRRKHTSNFDVEFTPYLFSFIAYDTSTLTSV